MARSFDVKDLDELALSLTRPGAAAELAVLAVCLLAAWGVARLMRGRAAPNGSILFGDRVFDGLLFPALALAFAFVGLMVALSAVGIDLTALSVLGGAIGVGLGFGLQKIAANYVSGFVILAERSVRIGDMVKVDGFEGCI